MDLSTLVLGQCPTYVTSTLIRSSGVLEPGTRNASRVWGATQNSLLAPRGLAVSPEGMVYISMRWGSGTVARIDLCTTGPMHHGVAYLQSSGGWGPRREAAHGPGMLDTLALDPTSQHLFVGHREGLERRCSGTPDDSPLCRTAPPLWRCNLLHVDTVSGRQRCLSTAGLPLEHLSHGVDIYSLAATSEYLYVGGEGGVYLLNWAATGPELARPFASDALAALIIPPCCARSCAISSLVLQHGADGALTHLLARRTLKYGRPTGCNVGESVVRLAVGCAGTCATAAVDEGLSLDPSFHGFGMAVSSTSILTTSYSTHEILCQPRLPSPRAHATAVAGQHCRWFSERSYPGYNRENAFSASSCSALPALVDGPRSQLYHPFGLACWPAGCDGGILLADQNNNALRFLAPKGVTLRGLRASLCPRLQTSAPRPNGAASVPRSSTSREPAARRVPILPALPSEPLSLAPWLDSEESRILRGRWVLVIGDSVARVLFMALVEALVGTAAMRAGHRPCMPLWRFPGKGSCREGAAARCVLDFEVNHQLRPLRLTFVWLHEPALAPPQAPSPTTALAALKQVLAARAPQAPDVLLHSAGAWFAKAPLAAWVSTGGALLSEVLAAMPHPLQACVWIEIPWGPTDETRNAAAEYNRMMRRVAAKRGCMALGAIDICTEAMRPMATAGGDACAQGDSICCARTDCDDRRECLDLAARLCVAKHACSGYHTHSGAAARQAARLISILQVAMRGAVVPRHTMNDTAALRGRWPNVCDARFSLRRNTTLGWY